MKDSWHAGPETGVRLIYDSYEWLPCHLAWVGVPVANQACSDRQNRENLIKFLNRYFKMHHKVHPSPQSCI